MEKEILELIDGMVETSSEDEPLKENLNKIKIFIEAQQEQLEKVNEENLQNIAQIQTMARRHIEEQKQIKKYGGIQLAEDILKPIDLFKKVLNSPVQSEEVKNYLFGFNMIANQLDQVLESNGITMIPVKIGDKFDHNIHNANDVVETNDFKKDQIVEVITNGYKYHDRVIAHAIVKVAK